MTVAEGALRDGQRGYGGGAWGLEAAWLLGVELRLKVGGRHQAMTWAGQKGWQAEGREVGQEGSGQGGCLGAERKGVEGEMREEKGGPSGSAAWVIGALSIGRLRAGSWKTRGPLVPPRPELSIDLRTEEPLGEARRGARLVDNSGGMPPHMVSPQ